MKIWLFFFRKCMKIHQSYIKVLKERRYEFFTNEFFPEIVEQDFTKNIFPNVFSPKKVASSNFVTNFFFGKNAFRKICSGKVYLGKTRSILKKLVLISETKSILLFLGWLNVEHGWFFGPPWFRRGYWKSE